MDFHGDELVYSETGVDLTLLRRNLRGSPDDRWSANLQSLALCRELQRASKGPYHRENLMAELDAPKLLEQLQRHQVDFVLVGGLAMIAHGSAYVTQDLDVCYSRTAT